VKQQIHRHFWIVAIGIAIALLVAFWPRSLTDTQTGSSGDTGTDDDKNVEAPEPGETRGNQRSDESMDVVSDEPAATETGALLNQQAMNAWQIGEIREAMSIFEQAIAADPGNPAPFSNYGRLLTLMVSYQEALPLLQHAQALNPIDAQVWLDLATLYERTQTLEKSWEARAEATKLVGADAIVRDEQGRFIVQGGEL
jgi:Flp pilus assembly protein TadD